MKTRPIRSRFTDEEVINFRRLFDQKNCYQYNYLLFKKVREDLNPGHPKISDDEFYLNYLSSKMGPITLQFMETMGEEYSYEAFIERLLQDYATLEIVIDLLEISKKP